MDAKGLAHRAKGRSGVDEEGKEVECLLLAEVKSIPHPGTGQAKQQPLGVGQTRGYRAAVGKCWGFTQ